MPSSPPAVRTLGGRPRAAPGDRSPDDRSPGESRGEPDRRVDAEPPAEPSRPRLARGTGKDEPGTSPAGSDDPWEALALAAVRTAIRAVRAADDGWAAKLARVAADPGVRDALGVLADAARRAAGSPGDPPAAPATPVSPVEPAPAEAPLPEPTPAPSASAAPAPAPPAKPDRGADSSLNSSLNSSREPTASLTEIQDRLTLGSAPPPSAAPSSPAPSTGAATAAAPVAAESDDGSTLRSEDVRELCRAPDRCRTKARALRWAADRLAAGAETGPLRTRREELEAAADPGEALWPLLESSPPGTAPADYLRSAAVFEVLADAALLLDAALERYLAAGGDGASSNGSAPPPRGEELDQLKAALDLTAEAQSMALIAVRRLREKPDRDQVGIYKTIRDISDARTGIAYFIRNYLREGSHADPADHADLASRIAAAAALRGRGKAEREGFKKFAHAAAKAAAHAADESPERFDYHADRMAKFAARLLGLGVPPSDVRFREAAPADLAPLRAAVRRLADQPPASSGDDGERDPSRGEARAAALARVLEYLPDPAAARGEDEAEDAPATHRYAASVDDALARAAAEYPQALAYAFNSKSVREGYPYRHPDRVYLGLKFLATTLRDALAGRASCPDLNEECVRQCGLHYSPNQSPSTMGQFPEDYHAVWGGEEVPLTRHLRGGNNKDPRLSIRLAFYYDRAADTVVVGYLGQHQRTRAT